MAGFIAVSHTHGLIYLLLLSHFLFDFRSVLMATSVLMGQHAVSWKVEHGDAAHIQM